MPSGARGSNINVWVLVSIMVAMITGLSMGNHTMVCALWLQCVPGAQKLCRGAVNVLSMMLQFLRGDTGRNFGDKRRKQAKDGGSVLWLLVAIER